MKVTPNYHCYRMIVREAGEKLDITSMANLCAEMDDVLMKNPDSYIAIQEECQNLKSLMERLKVAQSCPRCDGPLYLSDRPQYDFTCPSCDENF